MKSQPDWYNEGVKSSTYVYKCETCNESWEESLSYEMRDKPVEEGYGECTVTSPCEGKVVRVPYSDFMITFHQKGHLKKTLVG